MPLNLLGLQEEIEIALKEVFRFDSLEPGQEKDDTEKTYEDLAERLASAIDTFVRSGTVVTTVTPTPPAPTIDSTAPGIGTGNVT